MGSAWSAPAQLISLLPYTSLVAYPAYPYLSYALPLTYALPVVAKEEIPQAEVYKESIIKYY